MSHRCGFWRRRKKRNLYNITPEVDTNDLKYHFLTSSPFTNCNHTIYIVKKNIQIQSNPSYVTFQGNSEIWSYKTGGHLIQV